MLRRNNRSQSPTPTVADSAADEPLSKRRLAVAVASAVLFSGLAVVGATQFADNLNLGNACGPNAEIDGRSPDGYISCAHADEAPPGVDVSEDVSTADLKARVGVGPNAVLAADEYGVPVTAESVAVNPDVTCDGDGTSGYRIEAYYIVEASDPNRFASLESTFQKWAAGIDDVFNKSAAITGGVRHLRYVTKPAAGGKCVTDVKPLTLPDGSLSTFAATKNAMAAAGYNLTNRRYLLWADTSDANICGMGSYWLDEKPTQNNTNNGGGTAYARIDVPCWGLGNGTSTHSTEAHEILHTLGGVLASAPNSTVNGHCTDDYDTMCYVDGEGVTMRKVCPADFEYLLDCGSNDYFSTRPETGNWLATHWNVADSRFLIGGGNGTTGGVVSPPAKLGAKVITNSPAVPGLTTQVAVVPQLPTDRTVASVLWKASGCVFGTPTELETTIACPATAKTAITVSATIKDDSGATATASSPLTFSTGTARPVKIVMSVDGQDSASFPTASMCLSKPSPVTATVTDTATGLPVFGMPVTITKKTATATTASKATAKTTATGEATSAQTATAAMTYGASSAANTVFAASATLTQAATVAKCTPTLTADVAATAVYHGDVTTVSGTLTRTVGSKTIPVSGATVTIATSATKVVGTKTTTVVTKAGTAKTLADGSYSLAAKFTASGALSVTLPDSKSLTGTKVDVDDITVNLPTTALTADIDKTSVGYGGTVTVTGALKRTAATTTGVASQTVKLMVTANGKATQVATGRTAADGTYKIAGVAKLGGTYSAVFGGSAGLPAATKDLGAVTVTNWTTAITGAPSATDTAAGQAVTVSGAITKTLAGVTEPGKSIKVTLTSTAAGATTSKVATATANTTGAYLFKLAPTVTTAYVLEARAGAGYDASNKVEFTITVAPLSTTLTASPSTKSSTSGAAVTVSGKLTRSWSGGTAPATSSRVAVSAKAAGAERPTITYATVGSAGTYSAKFTPRVTTEYVISSPASDGIGASNEVKFTVNVG